MIEPVDTLPPRRKVEILTTGDDWLIPTADIALKGDQSFILEGGGNYIVCGGVWVKDSDGSIKQLINEQKGKESSSPLAVTIPLREVPPWVHESSRSYLEKVIPALSGEALGLIAHVNDNMPSWLRVYDRLHRVPEKLFVWGGCLSDMAPLGRLHRFIREERGVSPEEFFLIASSANLNGHKTAIIFNEAYGDLGDKDGIAVAVKDLEEERYDEGSLPIISALPFSRGRKRFLPLRENRDMNVLYAKIPQLQRMSKRDLALYFLTLRIKTLLGR